MDGALGSGKKVMDPDEFASVKIRPLSDYAGSVDDFMVMARTDSLIPLGLDDAIQRARLYNSAGAELLFIESPVDDTQLSTIAGEFKGDQDLFTVANMIEGSPKHHTIHH